MAEAVVQKEGVSGEVAAEVAEEAVSPEQATPILKITDEPRCAEMVGEVLKWVEERLKNLKIIVFETKVFSFESKALGPLFLKAKVLFDVQNNIRRVDLVDLDLWITPEITNRFLSRVDVAAFDSGLSGVGGMNIAHREVLDPAFMRRGVATACFDILEGMAVASGYSHTMMGLTVLLPQTDLPDKSLYEVQVDTLLCALGRGYLPACDDSKETVDRIERRDGFEVGKDTEGKLKAWPNLKTEQPMCLVKKDLRVSKGEI